MPVSLVLASVVHGVAVNCNTVQILIGHNGTYSAYYSTWSQC